MTDPSIHLSPSDPSKPKRARIPNKHAVYWQSPLEDGGNRPSLAVFVTQKAYVRVCAHAGSDLDNEVGGWLVGKWRMDQTTGEHFIVVETILPAPFTRQGGAFLTFTHDTQVALYTEMEARFPKKELVGWYHTHPRMGIFLSGYDTWLHHNFFPRPYQVALVIEPHSTIGGFFIRRPNNDLDDRMYYGFYEIQNHRKRSVVHWCNLSQEDKTETGV
jgi:proteasome lid subunit RPN8/RPN11